MARTDLPPVRVSVKDDLERAIHAVRQQIAACAYAIQEQQRQTRRALKQTLFIAAALGVVFGFFLGLAVGASWGWAL